MNPSALFIRRPVATTLITIAIALIGVAAFFVLPISALPQVDQPTISISANLTGASPQVMAATVATPLERNLAQIADVTEMTSQSARSQTQVTLQFGLDRDINGAARDVEAAINAARSLLPTTLTSNPTYKKVNPANSPILILGMTSDAMTTPDIYKSADIIINQALSQVSGVGQVQLGGGASPAVRVEMNPFALNKYGIGLEDVRAAIASTNAFTPKGSVALGDKRFQIYTNDQAVVAADYKNVIVAYRNGDPVRMKDIADVVDGPEAINNLGLVNGKPGIVVVIRSAPGANIIATIDNIKALLPQLRAQLPPNIKLDVMLDNSTTIRASLVDVERTLLIAIVLVVLVVLVFLRNGRATLIPGVAVTVSLLGTLGVMYVLHFSLDNLSLMALTIATGFVVDDAIVVLENITRHVEDGMPRMQAALVGAGEVGFTVVSMSISLIAVFIPILMMGGIVGRLFREFAITLSTSIAISLFISLTATPMMAARLIDEHPDNSGKPPGKGVFSRLSNLFEWGFDHVHKTYEKSLTWALDNAFIVLMALFATIGLTVYLYIVIPKGFFPQEDTGALNGGIQADQASSFDSVSAKIRRLQAIVLHDPAVATSAAFINPPGGFMFVSLKPLEQRPHVSSDMVIQRLRPKLARVPGVQLFLQSRQDIRIGGRQSNAEYQYTLQSDDSTALSQWSDKLLNALKGYRDLTDVNTDQQQHALESYITVDHQTASRLGLTSQQIDTTLNDAFGESFASIIYNPLNQYHVVMEIAQPFQRSPDALKEIYVTPPAGGTTSTPTAANGAGGASRPASLPAIGPAAQLQTASAGSTLTSAPTLSSAAISTAATSSPAAAMAGVNLSAAGASAGAGGGSGASLSGGGASGGAFSPSLSSATAGASATGVAAGGTTGSITGNTGGGGGAANATASITAGSGETSSGVGAATSTSGARAATSSTATSTATGGASSGAGVARSSTGGAVAVSTGVAISTTPESLSPLSAFASYALQNTPLSVNHQGTSVAATLSFNLAPGRSLSDAQRDIAQAEQQIGMPSDVIGSFQGTAQVYQQSLSNEPILVLAALVAVYIVLGMLYESYVHPLTVLSTLPSAGVGAVLALLIFHLEFSIIALIGVVLLIGIVKKNAIMIIDFALVAEREQGLSSHDAIYQACMLRFRPILMTTCAAILGALPLAFGVGQGAEIRQPLGVAIIGGLMVSQVLTLLTTPVVYLYLDKLRQHAPRRYPRGLPGAAPAPAE